jgi:hypothetical protein
MSSFRPSQLNYHPGSTKNMERAEGFYVIIFISQQKALMANLSFYASIISISHMNSRLLLWNQTHKDTQATPALPFIHAYNNARNFYKIKKNWGGPIFEGQAGMIIYQYAELALEFILVSQWHIIFLNIWSHWLTRPWRVHMASIMSNWKIWLFYKFTMKHVFSMKNINL